MGMKALSSEEDYQQFIDIKKHFEKEYESIKDITLDVEEISKIFSLQFFEF